MSKVLEFIKNKAIGYFIVAADALLALILAIIFFATYDGAMATNAASSVPETIGIFLLAGFVIELVVLVLPQYKFIHIIAIVMFGLSLYKEVFLIPNLIADEINNVHYQGGDLKTNVFYLVSLFIIILAAIVAAFMGFYKNDEEAKKDMAVKGVTKIATVGVAALVVVAAVLSSTIVSNDLQKKAVIGGGETSEKQDEGEKPAPKPKFNPITEEIRAAAEAVEYEFNPDSVVIKQEEKYAYTSSGDGYYNEDLAGLSYSATRSGHNLVYVFEGEYSEGYQGQYNTYSSGMYLWDDGLFAGKSNSTNFKGYWYNSSLTAGEDEEGNPKVDCLIMVSNTDRFESIITDYLGGFYERQAYIFMHPGWGDGRSVVVSGYKYYPDVAAAIDTNDYTEFKVGDKFLIDSMWYFNRIIKNLTFSPVTTKSALQWTLPDGMLDSNKRLTAAGEYEITGKWNGFEASATLKVTE